MSMQDNKAIVKRFIDESFNQRNFDAVQDLIAPDMIEHEAMPAVAPSGIEGMRMMTDMTLSAFPDFKVIFQHLIAEEDKVVVSMIWTGTHEGEFMGIPATGNTFSMNVIDIFRVQDGKLVEHWGVTDMMAMMQQLGVTAN